MLTPNEFHALVKEGISNESQQRHISNAVLAYGHSFESGKESYSNLELAKERAAYYKWKVTESLDKYLIEFESNVIRRGGKVIWALDAETALEEIKILFEKNQPSQITLSHTGVGEEIELKEFLKKQQQQVLHGSIGDYINSKNGKNAFQMNYPTMNKSVSDISEMMNQSDGVSLEAEAPEISRDIRENIHDSFSRTDMAITGANFLIAENGMVALTENEGNIRLALSFARTHLVIAGIDKIIPSLTDLDLFFPLLSTYATGKHLATYNTIIGPRQAGDTEGPNEFIVILVDNGRSDLLAQPDQRQSLSCIRCGACSMVCPVFNQIGGYALPEGPIGMLNATHKDGIDKGGYLSYASTTCGKCTGSCPVKIDIHHHLLRNRRDIVTQGLKSSEKMMWFSWKKAMLSRKNLNRGANMKQFVLKSFFKTLWGEEREFPKIAEKSFNQLWREKNGL